MEHEAPTAENVINSIDIILKKEHDMKTRIKFFLGILRVLEEEPEKLKMIVMEHIDKLASDL
jgi:hypothetical protein